MKPDAEFLKQLEAAFRVEAAEHLQVLSSGLLALEKTTVAEQQLPLIEAIYREVHSLKGAARAVNLTEVENSCQHIESIFAAWKRGEQRPTPDVLDTVHQALDDVRDKITGVPRQAGLAAPAGETVRISIGKLDTLLREAEELLAAKLTSGQRVAELGEMATAFAAWKKEAARLQPELRALRRPGPGNAGQPDTNPGRLLEFCEWNLDYIRTLETRWEALAQAARQDHHAMSRMVDKLLADAKKLTMLPFATVFHLLPKLVHDLCRDQGKEAELLLRGGEAEIDKRILEEMKDPLVHLVRNCVDHGLEPASERRRQGKPPCGTIAISAAEVEGNKIEVVVTDDGLGIDPAKVREAAIRQGVITAEAAGQLDEAGVRALIFQSEVSTRENVTALSGRGLGLAIVREKVEKLGGRVTVESQPGRGTTFRILLPLTIATYRGILIEVAGRVFVLPTANVAHVVRIKPESVKTVENRETLVVNGRALSLARLESVLELTRSAPSPDTQVAVVLVVGDKQLAFAVDAVLNETEVLVKPFHKPLARVRNVAGATILGSGKVVPLLNVADLLKSAIHAHPPPRLAAPVAEKQRRTVLVVEDSITSRMLLKNILESAGYRVKTAVDGVDALTALKVEDFDAVVSDIEMPRLNGFGLTEKIRGDKKLANLPVVLVTALETAADRERGVDVGANAYIVKSSFDQSNLLEVIERLV